ncbi:hypothetical protein FH972_021600 [Carpinus fangiana]|uniref:precorrin-2 dehydrogenase n=1 Tax=Carpinus fangiana TaxID=176857 RepID=A0A5N6KQG0_9ROSI|nr:hypothetical protein FH972_021600 [Carpinus fangiana]
MRLQHASASKAPDRWTGLAVYGMQAAGRWQGCVAGDRRRLRQACLIDAATAATKMSLTAFSSSGTSMSSKCPLGFKADRKSDVEGCPLGFEPEIPEVQGGGSLILAWQVKGRKVLVVGGGEVAAGRILNLLNADAKVTVISPREGLNREVEYRIEHNQVEYFDRVFEPSDLDDPAITMVLTAVDDPAASSQIYQLCHEKHIPANIADVPPECDFYFGSVHRDGPLQIMVSTNGKGPRLAAMVRKRIAEQLPDNVGDAIKKVGQLRMRLRKVAPDIEQGPKRMLWMSRVCEAWTLEDFCAMDEADMDSLLDFYDSGGVPSLGQLQQGDEPHTTAFDGSFGFHCGI